MSEGIRDATPFIHYETHIFPESNYVSSFAKDYSRKSNGPPSYVRPPVVTLVSWIGGASYCAGRWVAVGRDGFVAVGVAGRCDGIGGAGGGETYQAGVCYGESW